MPEPYESNVELIDSTAPATDPTPAKEEEKPAEEVPSEEVPATDPDPEADPATPEADPAPEQPVETLYELPDGRKVNAETLAKEFKENFLPDYTKKSQRIAEIDGKKEPTSPEKPWQDPNYEPKSYAELVEHAKREAIDEIRNQTKAEENRIAAVHDEINKTLAEIKATDPKLDENQLFEHANKYGFQDLKAAHKNMTDMKIVKVETEKKVVKNIQKREEDPVSSGASGASTDDEGYDPNITNQFQSASDFLAHVKGKK